eukprot:2406800-Rhodomonas_salina.2
MNSGEYAHFTIPREHPRLKFKSCSSFCCFNSRLPVLVRMHNEGRACCSPHQDTDHVDKAWHCTQDTEMEGHATFPLDPRLKLPKMPQY